MSPPRSVKAKEDPLYKAVLDSLPGRARANDLIHAVIQQIESWKRMDSENDPDTHADSAARLVAARDTAVGAIDKAIADVLCTANCAEHPEAFTVDPLQIPFRAEKATIDLHRALKEARQGLLSWKAPLRRGRGHPKTPAAVLTSNLQQICCEFGDLSSTNEFVQFLAALNDKKSATGLPTLSAETIKKQQQRARNHAGTNSPKT